MALIYRLSSAPFVSLSENDVLDGLGSQAIKEFCARLSFFTFRDLFAFLHPLASIHSYDLCQEFVDDLSLSVFGDEKRSLFNINAIGGRNAQRMKHGGV